MTRTFLVACDIDSTTDVDAFAADILDSLVLDGIPATSVKPWASGLTDSADTISFTPDLVGHPLLPQR